MAIATHAAWKAKADYPAQRQALIIANFQNTPNNGALSSSWRVNPIVTPAIPSSAVACDRTTSGALGQLNGGSGALWIAKIIACVNSLGGSVWICDRLAHQGGISGTATGATTTNLATAALTRNTTGVGVMAAVEIYTSIGATPQTFQVGCTNTAGTSGRTSEVQAFGGGNAAEAERIIMIPPQAGDLGFRSVESITPSASTGTAGNYGITLFKPLCLISAGLNQAVWDPMLNMGGAAEEVIDNACIFAIVRAGGSNVNQMQMMLHFIEG